MYKKLLSIVFLLVFLFSFTGCESNEINLKIITDGIVIKDDSLMLITDTGKKPTIYKSPYRNFNGAVKEIKKKYDLTPFLSHSKVVVISAEITVNELAHYIEELKFPHVLFQLRQPPHLHPLPIKIPVICGKIPQNLLHHANSLC